MLRIYIGFQAIKCYCFPSSTTTSTATTFLLFSLHHHHHISIVFPPPPPPPPHFYCFPPPPTPPPHWFHCFPSTRFYKRLPTAILSIVHFLAISRVVNNNRGFLQLLAACPAYQRQFLLKTVTPQQLHALVQVIYNILMGHIPIPEENKRILLPWRIFYLTWPVQMSLTKQKSESLYKRVVVLLKMY